MLELDENDASCEGGDAATSIRASGAPFPPFPPFPLFPPYPPYPPYPPCPPNPPVCPERPLIREPCADDHTDDNGANLGPPGWTDPDENGWQCWSAIFTLPITRANWPPRYHGAPDPAVTSVEDLTHSDMQEASRRLGALRLSADRTDAEQVGDLADIRAELDRLVVAFPTRLLADVPLNDSDAGANAPSLRLSLLEKLLILAVDPYLARVLGLYFVDEDADPGVDYDYCIAGDWGDASGGPAPASRAGARGTPCKRRTEIRRTVYCSAVAREIVALDTRRRVGRAPPDGRSGRALARGGGV